MRTQNKLIGVILSCLLAFVAFCGCAPVDSVRTSSTGEANAEAVKATAASEEMEAYLFVHFTGTEGSVNDEQIYFSVSLDGTTWNTLNRRQQVLTSNVGEKGVRDPHIIRSPEGDKFYMIATDLSIKNRNGAWGDSQTKGSKSIVVWESTDLVNWSDARLCKIAHDNAGCTWAPESIYDYERGQYMVFWASKTNDNDDDWRHRLFRCYTSDFVTFSEPEVYMESNEQLIDTTFLYEDGVYYRFTKNESKTYVYMEKGTSLSGEFEAVSTFTMNGASGTSYTGYEGPTAYKINGENKWCLLLDNYGTGSGYKPFVTDDITTGRFVSGAAFNFNGFKFRHGTVMPITRAEYDALVAAYPIN